MMQLLKLSGLLGLIATTASAGGHGLHLNRAHSDVAIRAPAAVQLYPREGPAEFSWYKPGESGNPWVVFHSLWLVY